MSRIGRERVTEKRRFSAARKKHGTVMHSFNFREEPVVSRIMEVYLIVTHVEFDPVEAFFVINLDRDVLVQFQILQDRH